MAQTTSSGWNSVVGSAYRPLNTGVLVSFNKNIASGINYFTINTSLIGGVDIIKGDGSSTGVSFFDKYQYTDYTKQVKNWSVQRDIGQFPFGLIMAQADVEFDNSSNMFLPGYDLTIGSGILPGRPLKISAGMGRDSLMQFTGFTGQPEISITKRSMLMHAYDVMDYLNNYTFSSTSGITFSGMSSNITTASAINYYLGKMGFNSNQVALDASLNQTLFYVNVMDRKFGDVLQELMYAEQGMLFADESGNINFWNRQHFNTTSGLGAKFNIDYSNAISIDYSSAPIINDVTVNARPRQISTSSAPIWNTSANVLLTGGTTTTIFADFTDQYGTLPVVSVDTPIYSVANVSQSYYSLDTSIFTNASSYISVSSTYLFGTSYKIVFTNSSPSSINLTGLLLYGKAANVTASISQQYVDQASIDNNGRNPANNGVTLQIDNNYVQDQSTALALAYDIVTRYSSPNRHFDVEIFSNPALQIGDFGTLNPDGLGKQNVWITGKTDKMNPDGDLTQLLKLEQRTLYNYFTINVSTIGGTDRIAP